MSNEHCKDCCCAQSWKALGISEYTAKSIPEHIEQLRALAKEQHEALVNAKAQLAAWQGERGDDIHHAVMFGVRNAIDKYNRLIK